MNRFSKFVSLLTFSVFVLAGTSYAQLKIGYVNSKKILDNYKEAQDVQKKLEDLNKAWEEEARNMQREIQELQEKLEAQALVLTEKTKAEKTQEIQNLVLRFQQFQQEKWGPNGQLYQEQQRLMQPVIDKINAAIQKVGETEGFDYIFDVVNGNILFASKDQPDLTDRILEELEKGIQAKKKK